MKLKTLMISLTGLLISASSFAQEAAQHVATAATGVDYTGHGVGLGFGLAILGAGIGQGKSAAAALEGMARNPAAAKNLFTPMILALVFTESLVLFGFALAFLKIK